MKYFISYESKIIPAYVALIACLLLSVGCATMTPLMIAAEQGNIRAVEDLLDKGADINERGRSESTALHQAAEMGHIGVVKMLLNRGADVNAKNIKGSTAIASAADNGHTEIVKQLLLYNVTDMNEALRVAAGGGHSEILKLLLDKGADLNAADTADWTPLRHAARKGRTAVVKMLLDRGANLDVELTKCEDDVVSPYGDKWPFVRSEGKVCVAILSEYRDEREEAKRQEQEVAKAKAIETRRAKEIKEIIREVVAETSRTQKQTTVSQAVQSDIDKPDIAAPQKIMGDNDIAVIIGIEAYQSLPKSDYSYDDARLVKEYAKALGFLERNIELITDEKATKTTIEKTLEVWLRNKAKPNSRIFVYYSGHGSPDPATGESYIVPYDGDPNYLSVTGYPLKRLYERLGSLTAAEVIVVLDSCFSGAGGRSLLAKGARPLIMTTAAAVSYPNMAVLSATQGAQISTSSPDKGHGVFTYYFLKALKEGKTSIADIYEFIQPQIEDEAKQLNVQQSPGINPDVEKLKGRFSLRK